MKTPITPTTVPSPARTPTPTSLHVAVHCGAAHCESEEGRAFLQARLARFGVVGAALGGALYVFLNLALTMAGRAVWADWVLAPINQLHLAAVAVFVGIAVVCRSRRVFCSRSLALADAIAILGIGCILGLLYVVQRKQSFPEHFGLLSLAVVIFVRAFLIPSSALQTALTSAVGFVPLIACSTLAGTTDPAATLSPGVWSLILAAWGGVVVAAATVASSTIFVLREEAHEARQLGQYTIEGRIGKGGMGEVYRASHALLRRPTAIKLMRPEVAGERNLARFEREVQLTSRLTHPNTIAIYDFGRTPDGLFYYAMEYLDGIQLEELVEFFGPQPPARVIHILAQVFGSLSEAHGLGLIHRDIKPANVILCERGGIHDFVKVVDFGLVKDLEAATDVSITAADSITGSPLYMSPEAFRSPDAVGPASDLYAVGLVGYFLLTGAHLFPGKNLLEIAGHHMHTRAVRPSERLKQPLPEDLEGLILSLLEKDPGARPESAPAARALLESCRDAGRWTTEDAARWWRDTAEERRELRAAQRNDSPLTLYREDRRDTATSEAPTQSLPAGLRVAR